MRVGLLLEALIEELDLLRLLRDEGPEGEDRAENVKELIAGALDFDAQALADLEEDELDGFSELDLFLQKVALVGEIDQHDPEADTVTLMTLHNAKGLEFPMVFIAGMEDGLFPLSRAYDEPAEMEEERRLFYVGITRSENKLYVTHARQRRRAGEYTFGKLSPFVEAIPAEIVEVKQSDRVRRTSEYSTPYRRRREAPVDEPSYEPDESFNQDAPRFVKGERVVHGTFGSGSVVEVSGFGRDTKVTVDFDSVGRKKLVVRYAGLEKDWDV
jgi:DNA helicase-2/ATP-dependent DNA helicase PcrA